MEHEHPPKRQKTTDQPAWPPGRQLPPPLTSPARSTYSHPPPRSVSSPHHPFPEGGNSYHDQNKLHFSSMPETRQPPNGHLTPYTQQFNEVKPMMKRESDAIHDSQHRNPLPSSRPIEGGQHRSPQSYNTNSPYEQPNGSGVLPYTSREAPAPLSMNGVRPDYDPRYVQSPEIVSADGIFPHSNPYGMPPANNQGKKKAQRASQACDSCRSLKAKCDESKPCQSCKDKDIKCTYRQPEPKAQDKIQLDMSNGIKQLLAGVGDMRRELVVLSERIQKLEGKQAASPEVKVETEEYGGQNGTPSSQQNDTSHRREVTAMPPPIHKENMDVEPEVVSDNEMGPPLYPTKPKFGPDHTTGALEILKWPAIKELVKDEIPNGKVNKGRGYKVDRYLWKYEKKRGEVKTHGYGEGSREYDGNGNDGRTSGSDASPPQRYSELPFGPADIRTNSQLPPGYAVGQKPVEEQKGGFAADGTLDIRPETVKRLVDRYLEKMNILHPILTRREAERLRDNFLREIKSMPDTELKKVSATPFIGQSNSISQSLGMHGRSTPDGGEYGAPSSSLDILRQVPQRSSSTAVVLLMLALGKICEETQKIPPVIWGEHNLSPRDEKVIKGSASPDRSSPSSPASSTEHTSPLSQQSGPGLSRLSSSRSFKEEQNNISGKTRPVKNQDVIPGMAYAAVATDIIGNQLSGSTMCHIQALILASLYYGQLVRPIQSHAYLYVASRAIQDQIRMKSSLTRIDGGIQCRHEDNPIVYAFWTCLQLECDIIAELPCVHSGILGYEELMPYPNTPASVQFDGMDQTVAWSYDAQLWLRKHLNDIHAHYSPPDSQTNFHLFQDRKQQPKQFASIEAVEKARTEQFGENETLHVPIWPTLYWNFEDKHPDLAKEILPARTRAKFYGARVITYRPFVETILKYSYQLQNSGKEDDFTAANVNKSSLSGVTDGILREEPKKWSGPSDALMEKKIKYSYSEAHWEYFNRGVLALIHSTTAFYGMGSSRLIVTNVFGTAHAQWGNVLVLLAVYNDVGLRHVLMDYITESEFKDMVKKTLDFLGDVAHSTSGLQTDIMILKAAARKANILKSYEYGTPNSSFDENLHQPAGRITGIRMAPDNDTDMM